MSGIIAALTVLLLGVVTGYTVCRSAEQALKAEVRENLLAIAKSAAGLTDGDALLQITQPAHKHNPTYERVRKPHLALLSANTNIAFIYTMRQVDGNIHLVTDSKLLKPGEEDDTSAVMERYDDGTAMMLRAFAERRALVEEEPYTDDWGTFLSGYAPLQDRNGRFIGVVGADIRLTDYLARLDAIRDAFHLGLGIAAMASILAGLGVWYVRRVALRAEALSAAQAAEYARRERLAQEEEAARQAQALERRRAELHGMADHLDLSVQGVMADVEQSIRRMCTDARSVTDIARDTIAKSEQVNSVAGETADLSARVSAAAQQLTASISEISQQSDRSRQLAHDAASQANTARTAITALSEWSAKVGQITDLISGIAFQINMLSINASIEAVRAGDAGKGFAVVANEVKDLAERVDAATTEIGEQIRQMQEAAERSVSSVGAIGETIHAVTGNIQAVAVAVEQQQAVTGDIARDIERAANGARDICATMNVVRDGAEQTSQSATIVLESSDHLGERSGALKANVDAFLQMVRAA